MATKSKTAEVPEGFVDTTKAERIPEPEPKAQATGHHELSDIEAKRVRASKETFDNTIQYLKALRDSQHDAEVQRMFSIAITHAETASMWAVKAITWRG
jgi:hypothetical protein